MADDVSEALEQLEAISREAEALATRVALDLTAATGTGLRRAPDSLSGNRDRNASATRLIGRTFRVSGGTCRAGLRRNDGPQGPPSRRASSGLG